MAHSDLALAASGTVTVEAALLGTPMVTFYKVTTASWLAGKPLVDVPFYSMVNLIAGRAVVPELMQGQMTGERIAARGAPPADRRAARDGNEGRACGGAPQALGAGGNAAATRRRHHSRDSGRTSRSCFVKSARSPRPWRPRCCSWPWRSGARPGAPRRSRIDVQDYAIEAEVSPNTLVPRGQGDGALPARGRQYHFGHFRAEQRAQRVARGGRARPADPASRNQQDFTVRLSFEPALAEGAGGHA